MASGVRSHGVDTPTSYTVTAHSRPSTHSRRYASMANVGNGFPDFQCLINACASSE